MEKKWERTGDLLNGSERSLEKNPPKEYASVKKKIYLGNGNLYYGSSNCIMFYYIRPRYDINSIVYDKTKFSSRLQK